MIVYLARPLTANEQYQLLLKKDKISLFYFEEEQFVDDALKGFSLKKAEPVNDAAILLKKCQSDIINFPFTKTKNGTPFIEELWNGHSNHWFVGRHMLYFEYRKVVLEAHRIIENCITNQDEYTSKEILVFHNNKLVADYLQNQNASIKFEINSPDKLKSPFPIAQLSRFALLYGIRVLIGILQFPFFLLKKKDHLLLTNPEFTQSLINPEQPEKMLRGNHYIVYLLEKASKKNNFFFISEFQPPRLKGARPLTLKKEFFLPAYPSKTQNFELFTFLTLLNPFMWVGLKSYKSQLENIGLADSANPQEKVLAELFQRLKKVALQGYFRDAATKLFFRFVKPKTVAGTNEQGVPNKTIFDAARSKGATTIGLQHAMFSIFYNLFNEEAAKYKPVPDYTLLWGRYSQNILLKNGVYSEENTKLCGQMRTDSIPGLLAKEKADLIPQLNSAKPVFVYASQPLIGDEAALRKRLAIDFFKLCKAYPDVQFVIKPHPLENDWGFFHNAASEVGTSNYQILAEELYKVLAVSDMVLTYNSTVGVEAIYFHSQLIVADYYGQDSMDYIKNEIALGFDSYKKLEEIVKGIIAKSELISKEKQDQFIANRAHKIDGQTTDRYLNFIEQFS